jgi:hypothetical protein
MSPLHPLCFIDFLNFFRVRGEGGIGRFSPAGWSRKSWPLEGEKEKREVGEEKKKKADENEEKEKKKKDEKKGG